VVFEHIEPEDFATFTSKYRSLTLSQQRITDTCLDTLRALHILSREKTPVPLEDRLVDELHAAELQELLEQERVRIRCTKLTFIPLTEMQNKRAAQDVKKEPVSIKTETDPEIKPKTETKA
jgi:hypothetical protein